MYIDITCSVRMDSWEFGNVGNRGPANQRTGCGSHGVVLLSHNMRAQ